MREESHLDDMRAAIRGDFERLAERRGGQELMSAAPETGEQTGEPTETAEAPDTLEAAHGHREPAPPTPPEPEAEPLAAPAPASAPGQPGAHEGLERPAAEPEQEPEDVPRRSWLARLLGR